MNPVVSSIDRRSVYAASTAIKEYVSVSIGNQMFCIPVLSVRDVLVPQKITRIPLAPREIAGLFNIRGRIVTVIDVRLRLGLAPRGDGEAGMSVVVDQGGELYGLTVDSVDDVLNLTSAILERNLSALAPQWRKFSTGIYRLDDKLLVVLEVARLLSFAKDDVN